MSQEMKNTINIKPYFDLHTEENHLVLVFGGAWNAEQSKQLAEQKHIITEKVEHLKKSTKLILDGAKVSDWDMSFLSFVTHIVKICYDDALIVEVRNFPEGADKLARLILDAPRRPGVEKEKVETHFFESIGNKTLAIPKNWTRLFIYLSKLMHSFSLFLRGKSTMPRQDFIQCVQECGVDALPIVALTSFLIGVMLAFTGSLQFKIFGAEVYTAAFVTLSVVRVMGPLITAVVLAGRTGASFAAVIGTMQVNEEIDALETFGISVYDFLILPRVLALTLMTPILCFFSDILGVLGGYVIGITLVGVDSHLYIDNMLTFLKPQHLWVGLFHGFVFGIVIALTGCYKGLYCGRSAEDVGLVTTDAVVDSLIGIVVATAILTMIFTYFFGL